MAREAGLEELYVGLTVKDRSVVEFWAGDHSTKRLAEFLIQSAIEQAGLLADKPISVWGYEYRLLEKGKDYLL